MSQLRKDPISNSWVIISNERGKRPSDFGAVRPQRKRSFCPFCEGNESVTPAEIRAIRKAGTEANQKGWDIRVIPNKFAVLRVEGEIDKQAEGGLYDVMNGIGAHEVIIEHPDHNLDLDDFTDEHRTNLLQIIQERINDLHKDLRLRYVQIFKNYGEIAGASLEHPHSQLIATPVVPLRIKSGLLAAQYHYKRKQRCLFCDMYRYEMKTKIRLIHTTKHFIAFAPFASRFPFEICIMPKKHRAEFTQVPLEELKDLSIILRIILMALRITLTDPPYNMILNNAPNLLSKPSKWQNIQEDFHWHIEIIPRLTKMAGFEWGTGFYINPTPPEEAANYLREVIIPNDLLRNG